MLKGMKGYQLTQSDLEFIKRMKEEQLVKKLQGDQEEVQRLLKNKMMALELAWASTEKAQAELGKIPSGEKLTEGIKMVMTSPRMGLTDVDAKSPLSMALVTIENFQTAMKEKQKDLDNHKQMLEMLKQEPEETVNFEKELAIEQLISQRLKQTLSDLKSEARLEEEYKSLQMNTLKAPADDLEHAQATTSEVERSGKGRKRRAKELPDTAIKANSTRRKRADNQMKVKDDHSDQIKSKALEETQHTGPRRSKRIANMQIQNK
ncbi:uncharacterized protein LOC133425322 [Cololabis saira]|uniref:uncharacterized protein LOC133425322 n=1 Tax=Cololabis saira TaxID=129043 RepID=UPI002AD279B7|nr:uncharacterized protein LOC133425322 [Cololabis saira]